MFGTDKYTIIQDGLKQNVECLKKVIFNLKISVSSPFACKSGIQRKCWVLVFVAINGDGLSTAAQTTPCKRRLRRREGSYLHPGRFGFVFVFHPLTQDKINEVNSLVLRATSALGRYPYLRVSGWPAGGGVCRLQYPEKSVKPEL